MVLVQINKTHQHRLVKFVRILTELLIFSYKSLDNVLFYIYNSFIFESEVLWKD